MKTETSTAAKDVENVSTSAPAKPASWRDTLKVHKYADRFPRLSPEELQALATDIKAHGLREAPKIWIPGNTGDRQNALLIDGISRLDAFELAFGPTRV